MKKHVSWTVICLAVSSLAIICTYWVSEAVTVLAENSGISRKHTIIIDAGHGGQDGGATSCTGLLESGINLEISLRLRDLIELLGVQTAMVRTEDISIHTEGSTIASKKISDLKNRVHMANSTPNAIVLSIHQNYFSDSRYSGAVVLYASTPGSEILAEKMQETLVRELNPGSNRQCKKAESVYLMNHLQCPGILIECGFLSNPEEEAKLRSPDYQKKLCCVIGSVVCNYLSQLEIS